MHKIKSKEHFGINAKVNLSKAREEVILTLTEVIQKPKKILDFGKKSIKA